MPIKATYFRQNLYQLLDQVSLEGRVLEIERNGRIVRLIPESKKSKFDLLEPHTVMTGEADDLLGTDWSHEWDKESDKKPAETRRLPKRSRKQNGRS